MHYSLKPALNFRLLCCLHTCCKSVSKSESVNQMPDFMYGRHTWMFSSAGNFYFRLRYASVLNVTAKTTESSTARGSSQDRRFHQSPIAVN